MGSSTKRALLGFAQGALAGAVSYAQTKQLQEAESLKEQRLAAIRAEERADDRAFQREQSIYQATETAARDKRLADETAARDKRLAEETGIRDERLQRQRREEIRLMAENQPPGNAGYVEVTDADGTPQIFARDEYAKLTPAQRAGHSYRGQQPAPAAKESAPAPAAKESAPDPAPRTRGPVTSSDMNAPIPEGRKWFDETIGTMFTYTKGQWVPDKD
jgi:hypothetical protein